MMLVDRRNRKNMQIFLLLCSFLLFSGLFVWFFRYSEWQNPEFLPVEVLENEKTERELAMEKVRTLQKDGLGEVVSYYDDAEKKKTQMDSEGAPEGTPEDVLFNGVNATALREASEGFGAKEGLTADAFYDEKLKQKQEEDRFAGEQDQEESAAVDEDPVDVIRKNETASESKDLVGKSAAVQTWLAKQDGPQKPLSDFESNLKVDEVAVQSQRRNPKFEQVEDPDLEKRRNRVHQFQFVQ